MFYIEKKVGWISYYWNQDKRIWEGLKGNATDFKTHHAAQQAIYSIPSYTLFKLAVV